MSYLIAKYMSYTAEHPQERFMLFAAQSKQQLANNIVAVKDVLAKDL